MEPKQEKEPPKRCLTPGCMRSPCGEIAPGALSCELCTVQLLEELDAEAEALKISGTVEQRRAFVGTGGIVRSILSLSPARRMAIARVRLLAKWTVQVFAPLRNPENSDAVVATMMDRFNTSWAMSQGRYELKTMAQMETIDLIHAAQKGASKKAQRSNQLSIGLGGSSAAAGTMWLCLIDPSCKRQLTAGSSRRPRPEETSD
jgi:hypothetical protein